MGHGPQEAASVQGDDMSTSSPTGPNLDAERETETMEEVVSLEDAEEIEKSEPPEAKENGNKGSSSKAINEAEGHPGSASDGVMEAAPSDMSGETGKTDFSKATGVEESEVCTVTTLPSSPGMAGSAPPLHLSHTPNRPSSWRTNDESFGVSSSDGLGLGDGKKPAVPFEGPIIHLNDVGVIVKTPEGSSDDEPSVEIADAMSRAAPNMTRMTSSGSARSGRHVVILPLGPGVSPTSTPKVPISIDVADSTSGARRTLTRGMSFRFKQRAKNRTTFVRHMDEISTRKKNRKENKILAQNKAVESFNFDSSMGNAFTRNTIHLYQHSSAIRSDIPEGGSEGATEYGDEPDPAAVDSKTRRRRLRFGKVGLRQIVIKWFCMGVLGFIMACIVMFVFYSIESIVNFKFWLARLLIEREGQYFGGLLFAITLSMLLGVCSASMVVYVAPMAAGSGLPEVKAYLNGNMIPGLLRLRTCVVKVLGLICAVSSGLFVGPEGPLIHVGTIVGTGISHGRSKLFGISLEPLKFLRTHKERIGFMTCGAAAGVSSAFLAPIGAVLFAYEEASSFWTSYVQLQVMFCSIMAYISFNLIAHGSLNGNSSGFLGFPRGHTTAGWYWHNVPLFIAIGVVGGLLGALFNWCNGLLLKVRLKYLKGKTWQKVLEATVFVIMTNLIVFLVPLCFPCRQTPITYDHDVYHLVQLVCKDGEYNDMATLLFTSPHHTLFMLFDDNDEQMISLWALGVHCVIAFWVTVFTIGIAVPSGTFVPTLLIGALYGRFAGEILNMILPQSYVAHAGVWAMFGASSMMAGMTRMTVSILVILVEIANDMTFLLPIMLIVMVSKWVGDRFTGPLNDIQMRAKNMLYLESEFPAAMQLVSVHQAMTSPVHMVRCVETVQRLYELVTETTHNGYPVKENGDRLVGLIRKDVLLVILYKKAFTHIKDMEEGITTLIQPDEFMTLLDKGVEHIDIESLRPDDIEKEMVVDVRFYMDDSPMVIDVYAPMHKAYRMFRVLGLRHQIVVDGRNQCVGILTRKNMFDLCEKIEEDCKMSLLDVLLCYNPREKKHKEMKGFHDDSASTGTTDTDVSGNLRRHRSRAPSDVVDRIHSGIVEGDEENDDEDELHTPKIPDGPIARGIEPLSMLRNEDPGVVQLSAFALRNLESAGDRGHVETGASSVTKSVSDHVVSDHD